MEHKYVMPSHCTPARAHSLDTLPQYPITTCGVQCNTNARADKQIKESMKTRNKKQNNKQTNKQPTHKQTSNRKTNKLTNKQTNNIQTKKQKNNQQPNKQTIITKQHLKKREPKQLGARFFRFCLAIMSGLFDCLYDLMVNYCVIHDNCLIHVWLFICLLFVVFV